MKALSVQQPWAWQIVNGYKDIENRSWQTSYRGRIYIHAGKRFDYDGFNWLCYNYNLINRLDPDIWASIALYPTYGIIGEVDIVACQTVSTSPWFEGPYGFVLKNPVAYKTPIPYKGKLGLFDVTDIERLRMKS